MGYEVQVSPQLSCGDTCQIWIWFKEFSGYFCKIENLAYGEINERSFSNPIPGDIVHLDLYMYYEYINSHCSNCNSFGCIKAMKYGCQCAYHGPHKDFVYSYREPKKFFCLDTSGHCHRWRSCMQVKIVTKALWPACTRTIRVKFEIQWFRI